MSYVIRLTDRQVICWLSYTETSRDMAIQKVRTKVMKNATTIYFTILIL